MTARIRSFFGTHMCGCGRHLANASPEHATYVLNGLPVCDVCYKARITSPEADEEDYLPERPRTEQQELLNKVA